MPYVPWTDWNVKLLTLCTSVCSCILDRGKKKKHLEHNKNKANAFETNTVKNEN